MDLLCLLLYCIFELLFDFLFPFFIIILVFAEFNLIVPSCFDSLLIISLPLRVTCLESKDL